MYKSRREFLSLAAWTSLFSAAGARTLTAGPQGDPLATSYRQGETDMAAAHVAGSDADHDLLRRIKAISNVFEVGRPEPDYAYVEDLGDGRGYTVTQYGFCSYNSEVAQVINRYAQDVPDTPLTRFLPHLPPLADGTSTTALAGFPEAWRKEIEASDLLGIACDEEADQLYTRPALAAAEAAGVRSAIGKSIFYDTWLQHGASTDPDSLTAILKRTIEETAGLDATSEPAFLRAFLTIRKSVLHKPANRETQDVWRASALRVDALLSLLDSNPDLVPPIEVSNADVHVVVR